MARIVNRGFTATLLILVLVSELALRMAVAGPPPMVRVVYGTTLAMYFAVAERLRVAAPDVEVLAMGDSLAMTQFQPDVFAADRGLDRTAVFNASYLALTCRSQEYLLRSIGMDRLTKLRQAVLFINPRRLTAEGNADADVFRVAIPDPSGPWRHAWRQKTLSPIFDYSRLYGLSRYLVSASWRQIRRPTSWDEVEYLQPQGGIVFEQSRPSTVAVAYPYESVDDIAEEYVADLRRVIELFRGRHVNVVLIPSLHHPAARPFLNTMVERQFSERMQALADETGSVWRPISGENFHPPETDFLDYGHLNRSGGIAFTHDLRDVIPPIQ